MESLIINYKTYIFEKIKIENEHAGSLNILLEESKGGVGALTEKRV